MSNDSASGGGKYREFAVLALVPGIVGTLIVASWALAHWKVGPLFVNAGLALVATLFGGWPRFLGGFQDIYRRKITVNVFVVVALIATVAVGEFRPAAIIIFIMAVVGALESYTLAWISTVTNSPNTGDGIPWCFFCPAPPLRPWLPL